MTNKFSASIPCGGGQLLKGVNLEQIMRLVSRTPGVSRTGLAEMTGLAKATVSVLVNELIAAGWLVEGEFKGEYSQGRQPRPLVLDGIRRRLLGAQITEDVSVLVAMTLTGETTELSVCDLRDGTPDGVFETLGRQIEEMCLKLESQGLRASGVGLAVPGPVHPMTGSLLFADALGWSDIPVREMLNACLRKRGLGALQVLVGRRVNCVAQCHLEAEGLSDADSLLYVHVGKGIAFSVITDGSPFAGLNGRAGVISHLEIDPQGEICMCGKRGCANNTLTLRAIERRAGCYDRSLRERYAQGVEAVVGAIDGVACSLGDLIHDLCLAYDPSRLLVGGSAFKLGTGFQSVIQARLEYRALSSGREFPVMKAVPFDLHAAARGAALLVMRSSSNGSLYMGQLDPLETSLQIC